MSMDKFMFGVWGAPGSGKTTLAVNLATVLADSGFQELTMASSRRSSVPACQRERVCMQLLVAAIM